MTRAAALRAALSLLCLAAGAARATSAANEDIEFVAEHLPEVAMANRYATLPVWSALGSAHHDWQPRLMLGYSRTTSGALQLAGPTLGVSLLRRLEPAWSVTAFGSYDRLAFSGAGDLRPLRTLAIVPAPVVMPVAARFDSRGGNMIHGALGLALAHTGDGARLGRHRWVFGLQLEQVDLRGYGFDYQILAGSDADSTGLVDFDGRYRHVTPFAGVEFPRGRGRWTFAPHALIGVPFPRRGVSTWLTGPGFDLSGDTDTAGHGKHFGDPSLALGVDATYEPWGMSVDFGSTLTQATLERVVHTGIDTNASLAFSWRF